MEIPKCYEFKGNYDKYPGETNPTTDADMQLYMDNQNKITQALADKLWQPSTSYAIGQVIHSPNMAAGLLAICVKAGTTGATEPTWNESGNSVVDSAVTWLKIRITASVNGATPDENGNVSVPVMTGASPTASGTEGLVPTPPAGSQNKALCGDGTFKALVDLIYPVGSLYWSKNSTDPSTLFGGTWTRVKDKFILAAGDSYAQGATGGAATVALTTAQMPAHSHTRGTMNIYGEFQVGGYGSTEGNWYGGITAANGAFTRGSLSSGSLGAKDNYNNTGAHRAIFTASNNWTGSTSSVGSGSAHNNMPPYVTYYCWERTA